MTEALQASAAILTGAALGAFYFTGLWWTLRRLPLARRPATLMLGSYLVRLGVCLAGFLLLAIVGGFAALVAAMIVFIAMRLVLVMILEPGKDDRSRPEAGTGKPAKEQTGKST